MSDWWQQDASAVLSAFGVHAEKGLTSAEAARRLKESGENRLAVTRACPTLIVLANQFKDLMVLVLLAAAGVSWLLGETADAVTILAIVLLNAFLGFFQEYRAERSLQALRELSAPMARVRREGGTALIPAAQVVTGDILLLEAGDRIAADVRLLSAIGLATGEAALTGESMPVTKLTLALPCAGLILGDRANMAFAGTTVLAGRGEGIVVATGMASEIGQVAGMIEEVSPGRTPLQERLEQMGRWLILACFFVCAAVGAAGVIRGEAVRTMFLAAVSLCVAAVPEGLPAVVTIALALGVQRMAKRAAVVRRLPAVETLGCATVICADKTGTLTRNEMTVTRLAVGGVQYRVTGVGYRPAGEILDPTGARQAVPAWPAALRAPQPLAVFLLAASACNNAGFTPTEDVWHAQGDPTEAALLLLAVKAGLPWADLERAWPRWSEIPFTSERRRMSVACRGPDGKAYLFTKGAADSLLACCTHALGSDGVQPLDAFTRRAFLHQAESMAADGLRVLALAYRPLPNQYTGPLLAPGSRKTNIGLTAPLAPTCILTKGAAKQGIFEIQVDTTAETALILLGLAGMMDPPRPESAHAIALCRRAGIGTVMITGDHPLTARAVGLEIGLLAHGDLVLSGVELDRLSPAELEDRIDRVRIYARVSPRHKLRIVRALKTAGHVVAMTGDGVNDAPAVKEADIGVAMGRTGTDVTKEVASLVILDDNFATIVATVEEGRAIYANIRKFIRYLLGCNTGEVLTMFLGMLLGLPLPLLPLQILWVNLITDGLPALALGLEPPAEDIMSRPPRPPREGLFAGALWRQILWQGLSIGLCTLIAFGLGLSLFPGQLARARTMAFTVLVLSQLLFALACRAEGQGWRGRSLAGNPYLLWTIGLSGLLQLLVIYVPWLSRRFATAPLTPFDWLIALGMTAWSAVLGGIRPPRRRARVRRREAAHRPVGLRETTERAVSVAGRGRLDAS